MVFVPGVMCRSLFLLFKSVHSENRENVLRKHENNLMWEMKYFTITQFFIYLFKIW